MRKTYYPRKKSKSNYFFKVVAIILVLATSFLLLDARIRPFIKTIAVNQAKNISTRTINEAVIDVLSKTDLKYDDIVTIKVDEAGRVTAIETDSIKMNRLKSAISTEITNLISQIERRPISIPSGTLSGFDFLSGRGPKVNLYITLSGSATAAIKNIFETAGINQTRHQIILEITTYIHVIMTGSNASTEIITNITIAETIIVGLVPEIYAGPDDSIWQEKID